MLLLRALLVVRRQLGVARDGRGVGGSVGGNQGRSGRGVIVGVVRVVTAHGVFAMDLQGEKER